MSSLEDAESFCAGGAGIYRQALPFADAMFLSTIHGEYSGDAFFPAFDEADWNVRERKEFPEFTFVDYRRK